VGGGTLKMSAADAQSTVGAGEAGSPVALGTAQRLPQDRDDVPAVPVTDAAGEERAERRVGEQPSEEAVDGSGKSPPIAS